ncbi:30S ribosomal protein S9 [Candidatus Peregrinibacteria bacterium]|nr:30S ribosomal protein S9 [Candidatus Peregrinibacteria bacterium]
MPTKKEKLSPASEEKKVPPAKKDTRPFHYAVGKRKTAVAKVRMYSDGTGRISTNGKQAEEYFFGVLLEKIFEPLKVVGSLKSYDVVAEIQGGGIVAQADALAHGISKALALSEEARRTTLRRAGFLTRDARVKERKKFGLKKARRSPQWSKR